jgi:hypothetical protein
MTLRQQLCKLLCPPEEPEIPFRTLRHRSGQHIRLVLQKQCPNARLKIRDREYSTLNLEEFNRWIQADCISERQYYADWHDCDDFADAIRCKISQIAHTLQTTLVVLYCEGYVEGGYHAFNMLLDDKDNIYIIEPQNDHVVPEAESTYFPDFIML